MGSKSDYLEAKILNHVLGNTPYVVPATVYVALFSTSPSDPGGGVELVAGTSPGYTRAAVTNNAANWPDASGTSPTVKSNGTAIVFATATGDWLSVVAFGIFDDLDNLMIWGEFSSPKTVQSGDAASFAVGQLTWTED